MSRASVLVVALIALCVASVGALKHYLSVTDDARYRIELERFGFFEGGHLSLNFTDVLVKDSYNKIYSEQFPYPIGLYGLIQDKPLQTILSTEACDLNNPPASPSDKYFIYTIKKSSEVISIDVEPGKAGLYVLYVVNCGQLPSLPHKERTKLSFKLNVEQYNVDYKGERNYLSAEEYPLPTMYGVFFAIYAVLTIYWGFKYMRKTAEGREINKVHYMMTALLVIKAIATLLQAIQYSRIQATGDAEGWQIVYYIFSFLRGISMLVVILMIGSGWSFLKPYLSDNDKKIFVIVIPLQILANIAVIVLEENMRGFSGWEAWENLFRMVDLICYGIVLLPVIWSLRRLRDGALTDGKARVTLVKLQLFRRFYLMLVAYIYFTRIIVVIIQSLLPYNLLWLASLSNELATLIFFVVTGHQFRPVKNNPYFSVSEEQEEKDKQEVMMEIMKEEQEEYA